MKSSLELSVESRTMRPVATSQRIISERQRLLFAYRMEDVTFEAEASPLPGFGNDSLQLARRELSRFEVGDLLRLVEENQRELELWRAAQEPTLWTSFGQQPTLGLIRSPAARFCVESLVLRILAHKNRLQLHELLTKRPVANTLATSTVVDPKNADYAGSAIAHLEAGVHTLKVKCGVDTKREVSALERLSSLGDGKVRLRVDANRGWTREEARRFVLRTQHLPIEWYEDPTSRPEEWPSLIEDTTAALAADEVLGGFGDSLDFSRLSVVVLKPMVLGGYYRTLWWALRARRCGKKTCLSHFFDGALAMDGYIALAFALQSPEVATGLGIHQGLAPGDEGRIPGLSRAQLRLPASDAS